MKSLFGLAIRKVVVLGIASLIALPVLAEQAKWKVDGEHSTARIFLGSNSNLENVGIARVNGMAQFNSAEPARSKLDISADLPDGQWLSFVSKHVTLRSDGKLEVSGEMTLAGIQRDIAVMPGEDYRGAIFGEPTVHAVTREVTFVLPMVDAAGKHAEISAEANLGIENFPELFGAVREADWQPVVENEKCEMAQAGEDYRGAMCSGRMIEPTSRFVAVSVSEDYRGFESTMPSGNQMQLVLRLKLSRQA